MLSGRHLGDRRFDEKLPLAQVVSLRHIADSFETNERERNMERARAWVQGRSKTL
ncbi:hypothetical protein [Novosphingobium sp. 17-62-19]|uniref:hypothetical protein n=1 Tax=Novosphingobium sp. 17-62-19 TaxID=1970406 RepID=UPI0025D64823|nr:hypothetical protein [Novosphingobium sp. 17-62-19]